MRVRTSAVTSLLGLAGLALAVSSLSCTKKKKSDEPVDSNTLPVTTVSPPAETGPTPPNAPPASPTAQGNGNETVGGTVPDGTTGSGTTLPKADLGLSPVSVKPYAAPADVTAEIENLARLNYLFELTPPAPKNVSLSDLESKTEGCVRSALQATRFETASGGFKLAAAFDFKKCVEDSKPERSSPETRNWTSNVQWAMRARCDNHDFKQYDGLPVTHPDVLRYLCHDATAGELYAHVRFEATELDEEKKVLRRYVRTRAFAGRNKETCAFVLAGGRRTYGDCIALDRIDDSTTTRRYLEVSYPENLVTSSFDAKGQKFLSSKVELRAGGWKGDVQFFADPTVKGTYQLTNELAGSTQQVGQSNGYPWPSEFEIASTLFKGTQPQQQEQQPAPSPTATGSQTQQQQSGPTQQSQGTPAP